MSTRAFLGTTVRFFLQVATTAIVVVILLGRNSSTGDAQGDLVGDPCAADPTLFSIDADNDGLWNAIPDVLHLL